MIKPTRGWTLTVLVFAALGVSAVASEEASTSAPDRPQPIKFCNPDYPRKALLEGLEGYVVLEFRLSRAGVPFDIEVIESVPEGLFDRVAIKAFECWRFEPADEVRQSTYTLHFSLSKDEDPSQ